VNAVYSQHSQIRGRVFDARERDAAKNKDTAKKMLSVSPTSPPWAAVDTLLHSLVEKHSFPGAVALVANASGPIYEAAVGAQTYDASAPPMVMDTHFDVASLTKVIVTTTCTMLLYQWGALSLDALVTHFLGAAYATADERKGRITVRHLLLHEAGYPPDPTPVSYCAPSFACPETRRHPPSERTLSFDCQPQAYAEVLGQPLVREPGSKYQYSDLSMITMALVVGTLAHSHAYVSPAELLPECVAATAASPSEAACYYEAFSRKYVFSKVVGGAGGVPFMGFRLPPSLWPTAAPTWNDTASGFPGECVHPYRERVLQGEVSDGNAYALGGVAGHAGLFATVAQLHSVVSQLLFATTGSAVKAPSPLGINATTVALFTAVHNASFSSRALGWDTQAGGSSLGLCGNLSGATFTHTGYTGTQVCADPATRGGVLTILLTNRVYPKADDRSEEAIHHARIDFNNAVLHALT
jgi:CubicO group peptidase (beta-lactamase class C family)